MTIEWGEIMAIQRDDEESEPDGPYFDWSGTVYWPMDSVRL